MTYILERREYGGKALYRYLCENNNYMLPQKESLVILIKPI
jgi:hypothetical protein